MLYISINAKDVIKYEYENEQIMSLQTDRNRDSNRRHTINIFMGSEGFYFYLYEDIWLYEGYEASRYEDSGRNKHIH